MVSSIWLVCLLQVYKFLSSQHESPPKHFSDKWQQLLKWTVNEAIERTPKETWCFVCILRQKYLPDHHGSYPKHFSECMYEVCHTQWSDWGNSRENLMIRFGYSMTDEISDPVFIAQQYVNIMIAFGKFSVKSWINIFSLPGKDTCWITSQWTWS